MRKNSYILFTAAAALTLSLSVFPAYAAPAGAIVGAPGSGTSADQTSAPAAAGAPAAAETKSAWESAAALEEMEKTGFVPALPIGDSIFSSPSGTGQSSETKAPETTAAKTTAAVTTAAAAETAPPAAAKTTAAAETAPPTAAKTTAAAETTAAGTTAAETTAAGTTAAKTSGSAEVVGAAPTEAPSTEAKTTAEETTAAAETAAAPETSAVRPETTAESPAASPEQQGQVTPETAAGTGFPAEMAGNGDMPDPDSMTGPGVVRAGNSGVREPVVNGGSVGATDWGSVSEQREQIVRMAESFIGGTYTYGGMSPETGFDCSGLVKYVFKNAAGINLPRTSADQAGAGRSISVSELQPGDLIAYDGSDRNGSVNHISIYVGDGMAVHAVGTGKGIRKTKWDYQPAMTIRNVLGD